MSTSRERARELAAERKRAQRARGASGAPTAEKLRKELFLTFVCAVDKFCRDTTKPEPTITDIIDLVAAGYSEPSDRARVAIYLGIPEKSPDHET